MLSVIVLTLNAAPVLARCLDAVHDAPNALVSEIIVCDGGSADETRELADAHGAKVITSAPGRGGQLAAGGGAASGPWLLFLHADSVLDRGWADAVTQFMEAPHSETRAAVFTFALEDDASAARRLERIVAWRNRLFALPYGDQGLLIANSLYEEIGGFDDMPIMEDVDMALRIGRRRLTMLPVRAVTSAEKYRRAGYVRRMLKNLLCLSCYFAGISPAHIVRIYR